jgi:hypothetical protein
LIIVHAGSEEGFVMGAQLIYKPGPLNSNYHSQMSSTSFEEWIKEKLIPNMSEKAVVIFYNVLISQ